MAIGCDPFIFFSTPFSRRTIEVTPVAAFCVEAVIWLYGSNANIVREASTTGSSRRLGELLFSVSCACGHVVPSGRVKLAPESDPGAVGERNRTPSRSHPLDLATLIAMLPDVIEVGFSPLISPLATAVASS